MVIVSQSKIKIEDDDDDDDLDALRLAALETLRTKDASYKRSTQVQKVSQVMQSARYPYKNQWPMKKNFYYKTQQRQNGVSFQYICVLYICMCVYMNLYYLQITVMLHTCKC